MLRIVGVCIRLAPSSDDLTLPGLGEFGSIAFWAGETSMDEGADARVKRVGRGRSVWWGTSQKPGGEGETVNGRR